jgi:hypothetical protein
MTLPNSRFWLALACAGCAQLAGFEDFRGAAASGGGGQNGGASPAPGGRDALGGRTGGSGGTGGEAAPAPNAGQTSDAGASFSDAGMAGSSSSSGGRAPAAGGASAGGTGPGGANDPGGASGETGGSVNAGTGGAATGGAATGGAGSGGTTGGNAAGGNATGGVPTATGGGPNTSGCGELIFNGDFSHGAEGWTVTSDYVNLERDVHPVIAPIGHPELDPFGVTPKSDSYLGWFGGVPTMASGEDVVMAEQVVNVSQDVARLEFSGFYRIETLEDPDLAYDDFYAELRTIEEDTQLGWQFEHLSNLDANEGWAAMDPQEPDNSDLTALRGKSFYFMLYSRTDADVRTDFWVDSISLVAVCP